MKRLRILITLAAACFTMSTAFPGDGILKSLKQSNDSKSITFLPVSASEATCLQHRALEEKNKAIVMEAFQTVWGEHRVEDAGKYYHENLIEHHPGVGNGLRALQQFATEWGKDRSKEKLDARRISAEGDYVWSHVELYNVSGVDVSMLAVFRMENEKIIEHWDVMQTLPELSESKNPHPLF